MKNLLILMAGTILAAGPQTVAVVIDGHELTMTYLVTEVPSAPDSSSHDEPHHWRVSASLMDSAGQPVGQTLLLKYYRESCVERDLQVLARRVLGNERKPFQGYVVEVCR